MEVKAVYGQDPVTGEFLCPLREWWGLSRRQRLTPMLSERVCYTATMAGSYEAASRIAGKWGSPVDDATIHTHVQQAGSRAESARDRLVERTLAPGTRSEVVLEAKRAAPRCPFSLVIMIDGWMVRERGGQWGLKPPEKQGERVAWHEMKTGIIFRLEQRARTQSGRAMIVKKYYEAYQGGAHEFGRRLYAEALRRGLNQAQKVYVVADGAAWIWNIAADRFSGAHERLDYYHASEHLWAVARALYGEDDPAARRWVNPLLKLLKDGRADLVRARLGRRAKRCGRQGDAASGVVEREVKYFENHRHRLDYPKARAEGCPMGSGAIESACAQLQNRFKRTGQFWTPLGKQRLMALELARRNDDWDEIWQEAA